MIIAVLILLIVTLVTLFSIQNAVPVAISFLFWRFEASLAIVIFLSAVGGVIMGAAAVSLLRVRTHRKSKRT